MTDFTKFETIEYVYINGKSPFIIIAMQTAENKWAAYLANSVKEDYFKEFNEGKKAKYFYQIALNGTALEKKFAKGFFSKLNIAEYEQKDFEAVIKK